jgi:hypothetical protein
MSHHFCPFHREFWHSELRRSPYNKKGWQQALPSFFPPAAIIDSGRCRYEQVLFPMPYSKVVQFDDTSYRPIL